MSNSQAMYRLKPIITHNDDISLPKCMYKIKNMNETSHEGVKDGVTKKILDISDQRPLNDMSNLEAQQLKLLEQIRELRDKIGAAKAKLVLQPTQCKESKKIDKNVTKNTLKTSNIKVEDFCDFVINVSPSHIPYSLLAVQKLWSNTVELVIDSYTHSTVKALPQDVQEFIKLITTKIAGTTTYKLYIKLIWKDVGSDTELILSPTCVPIRGEVNILRYLTRIVPIIEYECYEKVNEIDSLLDSCYRLIHHRTVKDRQSLVRNLNAKLGKSQFLCGSDKPTLADIGISSTFKQISVGNDLTINFNNYLQRCSLIMGY